MKKRKMMVRKMALDVRQVNNDLRSDYGVCPLADREMSTLQKKVSPQLYGMLMQQLLGFHGDMQYEMALNMVVFAYEHIANTTGCQSVDMVLDVCYTWIASEQDPVATMQEAFNELTKGELKTEPKLQVKGKLLYEDCQLQVYLNKTQKNVVLKTTLPCSPTVERELLQMQSQMGKVIAQHYSEILKVYNAKEAKEKKEPKQLTDKDIIDRV